LPYGFVIFSLFAVYDFVILALNHMDFASQELALIEEAIEPQFALRPFCLEGLRY